jgi:hypothetical protein
MENLNPGKNRLAAVIQFGKTILELTGHCPECLKVRKPHSPLYDPPDKEPTQLRGEMLEAIRTVRAHFQQYKEVETSQRSLNAQPPIACSTCHNRVSAREEERRYACWLMRHQEERARCPSRRGREEDSPELSSSSNNEEDVEEEAKLKMKMSVPI